MGFCSPGSSRFMLKFKNFLPKFFKPVGDTESVGSRWDQLVQERCDQDSSKTEGDHQIREPPVSRCITACMTLSELTPTCKGICLLGVHPAIVSVGRAEVCNGVSVLCVQVCV